MTKIRPITETDLARIATLPSREAKRAALENYKSPGPLPFNYRPFRQAVPEIVSAKAGPLDPNPPRATPQSIEAMIRAACRNDEGFSANMAVAMGLFQFAEDSSVESVQREFHPLKIGSFARLTYWSPAVIGIEKRAHVVFFDPRRGGTRLSISGRRFALSVMHQRVRVDDPDLEYARLAVLQFSSKDRDGKREVIEYFDDEVELFSFDELTEMVEETYELWAEVLVGREEEAKERGTGTTGPLL